MHKQLFRGRCFCGLVRFEVAGPAGSPCICHCVSCRRASGAPFVAWVTFAYAGFVVTNASVTEHVSSPGVTRGFCGRCGTCLSYRNEARPQDIDITTVVLDDAQALAPTRHIWVEDKLPWIVLDDALPRHARTTPGA